MEVDKTEFSRFVNAWLGEVSFPVALTLIVARLKSSESIAFRFKARAVFYR